MDWIHGAKEGWRGKEDDAAKKITREGRWGATEACVFLHKREFNLPIVRRWGIRMENYWRVIFLLFSPKIRMEKRNRVLLKML